MKYLLIIFCLLSFSSSFGQRVINKEFSAKGQVYLTKDIAIPEVNNGYTIWLPDTGRVKGLVVFTRPGRDTSNSEAIVDYALTKQLAVLYATTSNRLEFFFDSSKLQEIENYIHETLSSHNIPKNNMLYCGMSLEGTRALKLSLYGQSDQSEHKLIPKAIAICDAPLDMVRFHKEMVKAEERNITPITANEGRWVSGCLEKYLGGTPTDTLEAYVNYSPFCYVANNGQNLAKLQNIAIRCYTEPDVNWWIDNRRKDYYAMNSIDLAAFVNELKIQGNDQAELIITHNKGYTQDGSRHPHTWNIVDEKELIDWFVTLIK